MKEIDIKTNDPFLIPRGKFLSLLKEDNVTNMDEELLMLDWIWMKKDNISSIEKSLLSSDAQACCANKGEDLYDFSGVFCLLYKRDEKIVAPSWWEDLKNFYKNSDMKDKYGTYVLYTTKFLDEYTNRYTKEILKMSVIITLDWTKLANVKHCFPIPMVDNINNIVDETLGSDKKNPCYDESFLYHLKHTLFYIEDPFVCYPNFYSSKNDLCLQNIVFHGCENHDQIAKEEFTYNYNGGDRTIYCTVTPLSGTKVKVQFKTEYVNTPGCYMFWNHLMMKDMIRCIDKITVNNKYRYKNDTTTGLYIRKQEGDIF